MALCNRKVNNNRKMYIVGIIACLVVLAGLFFVISNLLIMRSAGRRIVSDDELKTDQADCILVLGAGV